MKIALDIHTLGQRHTGNETYMRNLTAAMVRQGQDIDWLYYHFGQVELPQWPGEYKELRWRSPFLRLPLEFPRRLREDRPDLAHFQYIGPPRCSCPFVVTVHDISFETDQSFFNPADRLRMRLLIPWSVRRAAHVLTVSEFSKAQIVEHYRVPEDRVTVTYNGVDDVFSEPLSDAEVLRLKQRYGLREPFILAVGNVQPRKNLVRLLRAFSALNASGDAQDWSLYMVGQSRWGAEESYRQLSQLGLEHKAHFLGYVDSQEDLAAIYKIATIFAYPSLYEGFGLPIVEAMAAGTPVLTSKVTSMPEVAGDAAVLVDPTSTDDIAQGLLRLMGDSGLVDTLVEKGKRRATAFNWETAASQTLSVYQSIL